MPNFSDNPNAYYIITRSDGAVFSTKSGGTVPATDATYTAWLASGNTATVLDDATALSAFLGKFNIKPYRTVSPRQIRIALNVQGLRTNAENWIATQDQNTKDSWDCATDIVEDNPLISACMTAIGKTPADRTALFDLAATIT